MPDNPSKLSQFWQELKRRKVVRVITVYAAAAFVILELVDIVSPSLRLPEWTMNFMIVLLCVGFIIAVILSWIYDIHPEGGIVKTEPAKKVPEEPVPPSSKGWKVASYISFVVIVGLIVLNIIPRTNRLKEIVILDKSIAVLPFHNDSPDKENEYFINGTMESILNNLCKIKDLRVVSRSSVEQYRDTIIYIPDVAENLKVSYILEGSMQKYGDNIRMTLQLIDQNDRHIWSEQYDRETMKIEELFSLQSEIAQLVAVEIKAVITPEEKQLIEKLPTSSLKAHDIYQRGMEEFNKHDNTKDRVAMERAESLFLKALEYDSTYADIYVRLAAIHANRALDLPSVKVEYYDSCFQLINIALSYDDELATAYHLRGILYSITGKHERSLAEFNKALKYDPNFFNAYAMKALWYATYEYDLVKSIQIMHKTTMLDRGRWLTTQIRGMGSILSGAGFPRQGTSFLKEALELDGDSSKYFFSMAQNEHFQENYQNASELWMKFYLLDTTDHRGLSKLGENYLFQHQYENSLEYFLRYLERIDNPDWSQIHHIGYAFLINGFDKDAEHYLNMQIENCNRLNETNISQAAASNVTYHWLTATYAAFGEKEKVIENLKLSTQKNKLPIWMVNDLKNDPIYDSVRDDPEFQQIVRDVEAKYQAEHERVRQWLEENDML